jgi:purine-binding chemotaxis protein CheW
MPDQDYNIHDTSNINWESIWKSLDWDDANHQQTAIQERLKQRASQYAKPSKQQENYQQEQQAAYQLLTFDLGAERYGIDVTAVTSVREISKLTHVPGVPSLYRGVVNVRGQIITVLDLRILLSLGVNTTEIPPELVVVKVNTLEVAILADHVSDVERIPVDVVEPVEMQYARGVTLGRLVVLDIEQLLSDERLFVGGVQHS